MFKASLLESVKRTIEWESSQSSKKYIFDDFLITNESIRSGATLTVSYRFKPVYSFTASYGGTRDSSGKNLVSCRLSPGELSSTENLSVIGDNGLISALSNWLENLRSELDAVPTLAQIQQQQQEIADILKQVDNISDEYFTREEAEQLRLKVDELEKMIQKSIQESTEDEKTVKEQMSTIKKDFETLKSQIPTLTKKGWSGSFIVRYHNWTKNFGNPNLLKSGIQAVKGLLVDGDSLESPNR